MPLQIQDKRDTKAFLKKAFRRRMNCRGSLSMNSRKIWDRSALWSTSGKNLILLACSCIDGVKGRMCDHVLALYYEKIMKPFSEQPKVGRYRRNSNAHWITMIPSKLQFGSRQISNGRIKKNLLTEFVQRLAPPRQTSPAQPYSLSCRKLARLGRESEY